MTKFYFHDVARPPDAVIAVWDDVPEYRRLGPE